MIKPISFFIEPLGQVHLQDALGGDVGGVRIETPMEVEKLLCDPGRVPESLDGRELVPIRGLCVVDLEGQHLTHLIGTASHDKHERAQE